MNEAKATTVLTEARRLLMRDPERALHLYRKVIRRGHGYAWSHAQLEVAEHEFGHARFQSAAEFAKAVLDAQPGDVDPGARAAAGILWCEARDMLELEIDEPLLVRSIEDSLAHAQVTKGAWGLMHLARRQIRRGERSEGKATILRAADLYDQAGAVNGGPTALQRLAKLELEDGNRDEARQHLDRGIAHLKKFPLGGTLTRLLEQRLGELREKIMRE